MTRQASGDGFYLVFGGTTQGVKDWRGGHGALLVQGVTGTPNFEIQMPDGVSYVPVKDFSSGVALAALAADGMFNFYLPACKIRFSVGGGAMNAYVIGV